MGGCIVFMCDYIDISLTLRCKVVGMEADTMEANTMEADTMEADTTEDNMLSFESIPVKKYMWEHMRDRFLETIPFHT